MRFILIDVLLVVVAGGIGMIALGVIRDKRNQTKKGQLRMQRKQGAKNLELDFLRKERTCFVCGEETSSRTDFWDPATGWHHRRCMDKLEKEI